MAEGLASFISGTGTTMEAIVRACNDGTIPDTVVGCVIASKPGIPGIERARRADVGAEYLAADVLDALPRRHSACCSARGG
jgi:phosphoribosylglycinamide formyltransferase-1